jgi:hypothetical protein
MDVGKGTQKNEGELLPALEPVPFSDALNHTPPLIFFYSI